eukprot:8531136-Pyramimonas_sp.AAC.1
MFPRGTRHVVLEGGKGHFRLHHPELRQVARRVAVLRAEGRSWFTSGLHQVYTSLHQIYIRFTSVSISTSISISRQPSAIGQSANQPIIYRHQLACLHSTAATPPAGVPWCARAEYIYILPQ